LAAGHVPPDHLEMAARVGADPHVLPRRRDHQRLDALDRGTVVQRLAVGADVPETGAGPAAAVTGCAGVTAPQAHGRSLIAEGLAGCPARRRPNSLAILWSRFPHC